MSRARRENRPRISALGAPVGPAAAPAPQAGPVPQASPAAQAGPIPQASPAAQAGPIPQAVPSAPAAIPQGAAAANPPVGPPGVQAPAQGINDQAEAQRIAREEQLLMQLHHPLRAPVDPVELDKRLVIDGMRRVKDLREGEYEDWILKVSDALLQAGMHAMFNITGVQRDELADAEDLRVCSLYPQHCVVRSSLPANGPAQAKTLSIRAGDLKTLLRTIRTFYECNSINEQHSILTKLSNTSMTDFPDLRSYVASLDANFARLAKMGNPQRDDTKRFFLLKGLSAEFERNCLSTIISYESRDGLSGAN